MPRPFYELGHTFVTATAPALPHHNARLHQTSEEWHHCGRSSSPRWRGRRNLSFLGCCSWSVAVVRGAKNRNHTHPWSLLAPPLTPLETARKLSSAPKTLRRRQNNKKKNPMQIYTLIKPFWLSKLLLTSLFDQDLLAFCTYYYWLDCLIVFWAFCIHHY